MNDDKESNLIGSGYEFEFMAMLHELLGSILIVGRKNAVPPLQQLTHSLVGLG